MQIRTLLLASLFSTSLSAHDYQSSRPDAHAPISVMGDHTHKTGEWMASYRFMEMNMGGLQSGKDSFSSSDFAASGYRMNATEMTMDMHMFGLMYAPSDSITLMAMVNYLENDMTMDMKNMMGMGTHVMKMESAGLGDIKVGALKSIYQQGGRKLHLNLMMSLPTGSIDETTSNMMGDKVVQAYAMQLGSGTYDLLPGITYSAQSEMFSWGAQASAVIRLGENDRDYTLGDRFQLQSWVQKPLNQNVSVSLRLAYDDWQGIDGEDSRLAMMAMMNPLADANLQGGERFTAGLGLNVALPSGHRLALEYNNVLEQDLDGLQMVLDDSITLGWQLAF